MSQSFSAPSVNAPVPPAGLLATFAELDVCAPIARTLASLGYDKPTPIQAQAIPHLMGGRDLVGCAQTGTGKTAAFLIPIIERLSRPAAPARKRLARALVLTPTRELAAQIHQSFSRYSAGIGLRGVVIYGGVSQTPQVHGLRVGADIIVATPGRLLDLIDQRHVDLGQVEMVVLDEADRMLDMGFIEPIRQILQLVPRDRQTMLFSATMPPAIARLAESAMRNPIRVNVAPPATLAENISHSVMFVPQAQKGRALLGVLADPAYERVLVFTRTKHGANRLAQNLDHSGVSAQAIHGNKSQAARNKALASFKAGQTRVLVATDVVARGIDVQGISHVVNYEIPEDPANYVHRVGRAGRAGATGCALSLCDAHERGSLKDIERTTHMRLNVIETSSFPVTSNNMPTGNAVGPGSQPRSQPGPRRNRNYARRRFD